jgi:hypothetical protein
MPLPATHRRNAAARVNIRHRSVNILTSKFSFMWFVEPLRLSSRSDDDRHAFDGQTTGSVNFIYRFPSNILQLSHILMKYFCLNISKKKFLIGCYLLHYFLLVLEDHPSFDIQILLPYNIILYYIILYYIILYYNISYYIMLYYIVLSCAKKYTSSHLLDTQENFQSKKKFVKLLLLDTSVCYIGCEHKLTTRIRTSKYHRFKHCSKQLQLWLDIISFQSQLLA